MIFEIPIGPAQSQHSIIEKTHCKTSLLPYYRSNFGQVNVIGKVEIIQGGQTTTEDVPK